MLLLRGLSKGLAGIAGIAILATVAHFSVIKHGGYALDEGTILPWVVALCLLVASICFADLWNSKDNRRLAVVIILCVTCNEAYNVLTTAERDTAARDAAQEPIRRAKETYDAAQALVKQREDELLNWPATNVRIDAAVKAREDAQAEAMRTSAGRHCNTVCANTIAAGLVRFDDEIKSARKEHEGNKAAAEQRHQTAKIAADAMQPPQKPQTLAHRLSVAEWAWDLLMSFLKASGINGSGAAFLAYCFHGLFRVPGESQREGGLQPTKTATVRLTMERAKIQKPKAKVTVVPRPKAQLTQYVINRLEKVRDTSGADLAEIALDYHGWCKLRDEKPLPPKQLCSEIVSLLQSGGVPVEQRDGKWVVVGVALKGAQGHSRALVAQEA